MSALPFGIACLKPSAITPADPCHLLHVLMWRGQWGLRTDPKRSGLHCKLFKHICLHQLPCPQVKDLEAEARALIQKSRHTAGKLYVSVVFHMSTGARFLLALAVAAC